MARYSVCEDRVPFFVARNESEKIIIINIFLIIIK